MARNINNTHRNTPAAPSDTAPRGNPAYDGEWEEADGGSCAVRSFQYIESIRIEVKGKPYEEYMPRIARSDTGLVPVLPCKDLDTGEECLLILPGFLNSYLRRKQPRMGAHLEIARRGKDPETGAWKLAVRQVA